MEANTYIVVDFDSTLVTVETLDWLADIVLEGKPEKDKVLKKITAITNMGMDGEILFQESLSRRLGLLSLTKKDVENVSNLMVDKVTPSFLRNKDFLKIYGRQVYIFSGGFVECIKPVAEMLGIPVENIYANEFIYEDGEVVGVDLEKPMSKSGGKLEQLKALRLKGRIYVLGDGKTDLEMRKASDLFVAFTENVSRQPVIEGADYSVKTFDEFLEKEGLR